MSSIQDYMKNQKTLALKHKKGIYKLKIAKKINQKAKPYTKDMFNKVTLQSSFEKLNDHHFL